MRALIQRVVQASVSVDQQVVGSIGRGLVVFLGVGAGDTAEDASYLAEKIAHLRIFADAEDRFNLSALETGGQVLLVSQFTLYADTRKGRRPSFVGTASPQEAEPLFQQMATLLRERGLHVDTGRFQQHMLVSLVNDGPVTILLDSQDRHKPRKS
ncbi:MAG: D-tyrosyl-tRNA(Tyr) deacylase [Dehalococcoidia bacterium]|nr:D-tyrosyl-tRNA(Tyr) deacylase [Dehalococcoidia bacterium]